MKHLLAALGLLLSTAALGQTPAWPPTLQPSTVVGRLGSVGPAQAIPFATLTPSLLTALACTSGLPMVGNGAGAKPTCQQLASAGLTAVGTLGTYGSGTQIPVFTVDAAGRVTGVTNTAITVATTAQYWANTAGLILTTDQVWAAGALVTLTDGATVTPDFSVGLNFTWTLGAVGRTLANPSAGNTVVGKVLTIFLVQDSGGSRTITSWGTSYKFSGGTKPTLSTGVNAVDRLQCQIRTSTYFVCTFQANFS